jgi:hypothetical protein
MVAVIAVLLTVGVAQPALALAAPANHDSDSAEPTGDNPPDVQRLDGLPSGLTDAQLEKDPQSVPATGSDDPANYYSWDKLKQDYGLDRIILDSRQGTPPDDRTGIVLEDMSLADVNYLADNCAGGVHARCDFSFVGSARAQDKDPVRFTSDPVANQSKYNSITATFTRTVSNTQTHQVSSSWTAGGDLSVFYKQFSADEPGGSATANISYSTTKSDTSQFVDTDTQQISYNIDPQTKAWLALRQSVSYYTGWAVIHEQDSPAGTTRDQAEAGHMRDWYYFIGLHDVPIKDPGATSSGTWSWMTAPISGATPPVAMSLPPGS